MAEMRIRALTTAIYLLQPQGIPFESPISAVPSTNLALSKAYNHLAILLSQGAHGAVAVTGNTDRSAICAVNIQEIEDNLHVEFRENADTGPSHKTIVKAQKIEPSTTSLHNLADPSVNPPSQEVSLDAHGSDLFRALIDLSNDRRRETKTEFMRFIWLRCHRKMKARLKADEVMLGTPLHEILQAWSLTDVDVVKETHFRIHPNLYSSFDSSKIPYQVIKGTTDREYLFSRSTVPAWSSIFVKAFAKLKDAAKKCDTQVTSIDELNKKFFTLHFLLYDNRAFETILAIRSLSDRVHIAALHTNLDNPNDESGEDYDAPFDEDLENPVVHCCMAMVAWHRAALSLSRSKIFRANLPQFHMIFSYYSIHNSSITDLETLMKTVILPELSWIPNAATHVDRLLNLEKFAKKIQFTGTIHCEATLMALIHSFTSMVSPKRVALFTNMVTPDLRLLFSNGDRVIGVAKKSCLCCYWLSQLLQTDTKEPFVLPGTHGIIFPWTPPLDGTIPFEVLESLQKKLVSKLVEVTTTWIRNNRSSIWDSSRISRSSDHEDVDMDSDSSDH